MTTIRTRRTSIALASLTAAVAVALVARTASAGPSNDAARLRNTTSIGTNDQGTAKSTGTSTARTRTINDAGKTDDIELAPTKDANGNLVSATSSMDAYLTASINDVDGFWSKSFAGWGLPEPQITYDWTDPGESVYIPCGGGEMSNDWTAEYCSANDTITVSKEAAANFWNGKTFSYSNGGEGDMTVAIMVAHEYGHNLEQELGWLDKISAAAAERGADCFAGVWAADAASRGILDQGDLGEASQAMDLFAEHAGQTDGVHGTTAERQAALNLGFTSGAAACVNAYFVQA